MSVVNLLNVKPTVGLKLEICDPDNIWSSAKIVKLKKKKRSGAGKANSTSGYVHIVTVRYIGWGDEWDEDLEYENNPRLAKLHTFTKRVKCLVDLFPKRVTKSKSMATIWPCAVNIRCPSPLVSLEEYLAAEELLRLEQNIFIEPYGLDKKYLAQSTASSCVHGGRWINVARIRMWRNDMESEKNRLQNNFNLAYKLALKDSEAADVLPYAAFGKGSLINPKYRETPDGYVEDEMPYQNQISESSSASSSSSSVSTAASNHTSQSIFGTKGQLESRSENNTPCGGSTSTSQLIYEPPPLLPKPGTVGATIYTVNNGTIRKSTKTGKFIASLTVNGNDVILGQYTTQTEANHAISASLMTTKSKKNEASSSSPPSSPFYSEMIAKCHDMKNVTLGAIIYTDATSANSTTTTNTTAATNNNSSINNNKNNRQQQQSRQLFSLHEWTMQHTKHQGYQLEKFRAKFEELKKERELARARKERGGGGEKKHESKTKSRSNNNNNNKNKTRLISPTPTTGKIKRVSADRGANNNSTLDTKEHENGAIPRVRVKAITSDRKRKRKI